MVVNSSQCLKNLNVILIVTNRRVNEDFSSGFIIICCNCSLDEAWQKDVLCWGETIHNTGCQSFTMKKDVCSSGDFYFPDQQPQSWRWWECCSSSDTVKLYHTEAEGWINSPAGKLFRWWDVDLQLWDLAKANIHLNLPGSIQLCSTLTSCSLPLFTALYSWGMSLLNYYYFLLSVPLILHLTPPCCPQELYYRNCQSFSLVFFSVNWAWTATWWMLHMYKWIRACSLFYLRVISITTLFTYIRA